MTSIEERLRLDIDAVTGELVTSEQELREARAELDQRIGRSREHRRGVVGMVAAAASVVVVMVATWQVLQSDDTSKVPIGPATGSTEAPDSDEAFLAGEKPTTDQLLGVWRAHDPTVSRILWMFTADGVVRLDEFGSLVDSPMLSGRFELTDGAIDIRLDGGVGMSSCPDRTWTLRAALNEDGGLNLMPTNVDIGNLCGRPARSRWVFDQVLPAPAGAPVLGVPPDTSGGPPPRRAAVQGTWYDPAAGYVVELRNDGGYTMLTGQAEVADRGTWTMDKALARLTLVSAAGSATCEAGDQLVLVALSTLTTVEAFLQGEVERNDCAVPFDQGWLKLLG